MTPMLGIMSSAGKNLAVTVNYLVVAGGGAGFYLGTYLGVNTSGGGGGGGGMRTGTLVCAKGTSLTVTVGAGSPTNQFSRGSSSVFSSITSTGGGNGSYNAPISNQTQGGSNGGGNTGATSSPTQGNAGGATGTGSPTSGGGGGGAGAVGSAATSTNGGNAGNGSASSITGSSVTYAGGGGGGGTSSGGTGGTGGGGAGAVGAATAGTVNTGGGGGGSNGSTSADQGSGGSGIVVISYPTSNGLAASTTGSPTQTSSGGNYIYKWTGSGSITL